MTWINRLWSYLNRHIPTQVRHPDNQSALSQINLSRTLQLHGIVWYGIVSIPEKLSLILDASEFEFVIVDSVGVLGRDFRSFRFPLNFNRRSQLVDDGLSNESYYDLGLAICQRSTHFRVGDVYVPDLTFRNLSGFDEKLDPNLKLFFKFFVRLSIFSLDSTFFLPQPLTVFFYLWCI